MTPGIIAFCVMFLTKCTYLCITAQGPFHYRDFFKAHWILGIRHLAAGGQLCSTVSLLLSWICCTLTASPSVWLLWGLSQMLDRMMQKAPRWPWWDQEVSNSKLITPLLAVVSLVQESFVNLWSTAVLCVRLCPQGSHLNTDYTQMHSIKLHFPYTLPHMLATYVDQMHFLGRLAKHSTCH